MTPLMIEFAVRAALIEDLGLAGDITTNALVPEEAQWRAVVVCRSPGVLAGTALAAAAFRLLDPMVTVSIERPDGTQVGPKAVVMRVAGPARAILSAERVALNFLGRLSGIATLTHQFVEAVGAYPVRIVETRKTTPGLRAFEKDAVLMGGGGNHRFGLFDAVLIKDNHIAFAGSITTAVQRARARMGHLMPIEVEVDSLAQLAEALDLAVPVILLDNMTVAQLGEAVRLTQGRAILEASGGITLQTARAIAATGVNILSVGGLTQNAPALDVGLDAEFAG